MKLTIQHGYYFGTSGCKRKLIGLKGKFKRFWFVFAFGLDYSKYFPFVRIIGWKKGFKTEV